jgi:hypothetical protein
MHPWRFPISLTLLLGGIIGGIHWLQLILSSGMLPDLSVAGTASPLTGKSARDNLAS